jgi:pimeloyl-ACP methyl ester carboxylesterase
MRLAIARVRLPLSHDAVHARKRVTKIVVRNLPHPVLLPGIGNTIAPVVQKAQYSGLQIWGLTPGKEYPVILVPGIMGTSLSEDGEDGPFHEPWPNALTQPTPGAVESTLASLGFNRGGGALNPSLQPCELMGQAYWQASAAGLDFYHGMVVFMQDHMGYRLAKSEQSDYDQGKCVKAPYGPAPKDDCTLREDLYTFPYDWRRATTNAASDLKNLVQTIKTRTGAEKVDIVAHSLGGIVSRIYLSQGGAADVDTYITLGTPFYGAPKVFSLTRYGQNVASPWKDAERRGFKETARNMWGVYVLLPSAAYEQSAGPFFTYAPDGSGPGMDYGGWTAWMEGLACSGDFAPQVCSGDEKFYNASLVDWARGLHAQIDSWDDTSDDAPWKYAIIGSGNSTLTAMGDTGQKHISTAIRCEDGDGSVAPKSAMGFPPSAHKHVFIKVKHDAMANNVTVQKQVQLFIPGIEELAPGASSDHGFTPDLPACVIP